jgi:hypothetical protein
MPRFSRRNNKRYKKVITRRKKNRFTRKNGGSGPAMVILKNEPLVWSFKTN